ncbi:hypothetical protein AI2719V1_1805 [Enterobacter cloacae]|uniref:Uncharacterized protein n=1 Tax=Enterobacter roggenkampii TaxID=1812935 RepID=A0ABD7KDY5_9ENTR|nr:hypothetical protein L380_04034 [Enterobacter roggenkampii MGH 34]CAE6246636.1 hypothetical protein AI2704V1_1930 [Enterobacter cloacae]SAB62840.1 Uncharacterised protein [Enterobacter roggenkampii]CAE6257706.1 hypothetical protein AI2705V1_2368 [Enterobacter cloacae]CAE6313551.1 hypothetical protein AI2710V1_2022 [Enterobacter cloacae]
MLFSSLGFLLYSRFGRFFVVLFSSLGFLLCSWFGRFFVVLFSGLGFLLCSRFSGFMMFLVMDSFCWRRGGRCSRCRSSRCSSGFSSERSRRQTHSSGNNQS